MTEEDQEKFRRELGQIKSGNPKHKSEMQLYTIKNFFFNKVAACNFIKKETLVQVFSYEFCEISRKHFFTEHVWTTVSKTRRSRTET